MKKSAEIERVIISYNSGNLIYCIISGLQKNLCIADAERDNKLHGSGAGIFFEISYKPANAHISGSSIFLNIDITIVILMETCGGSAHFIFQ